VLNLSQVYDSASVGTGKTTRIVPIYTIADGNGGLNYRVTLIDHNQSVISQGVLTPADAGASLPPVLAPTAVPRFPGDLDLRPSVIDLPMPSGRGLRDLGFDVDDEEKMADQPQANKQSPG
jgi:hypothetical protein